MSRKIELLAPGVRAAVDSVISLLRSQEIIGAFGAESDGNL